MAASDRFEVGGPANDGRGSGATNCDVKATEVASDSGGNKRADEDDDDDDDDSDDAYAVGRVSEQ